MFETIIGWTIWGTVAVGYLAMLALTERSAARFVRDARTGTLTRTAGADALVAIRAPGPASSASVAAEQGEQLRTHRRFDHGLATQRP